MLFERLKTRRYVNSVLMTQLLPLGTHSKNPKESYSSLKRIIKNLQKCQVRWLMNAEELNELQDMEMELYELHIKYQNEVQDLMKRISIIKSLITIVYIISFVLIIAYPIFYYYNEGPPNYVQIMMTLSLLVYTKWTLIIIFHNGILKFPFFDIGSADKNQKELKMFKKEQQKEACSSILITWQQLKLVELFSENIETKRKKIKALEKRRDVLKLINYFPFLVFILILMGCCIASAIKQLDALMIVCFLLVFFWGFMVTSIFILC